MDFRIFLLMTAAVGLFPPQIAFASIPAHAHAKLFGEGWECDRGFSAQGETCAPVAVPEHGQLNLLGNGWECRFGYIRQGEGCVLLDIPENGEPDPFGQGWKCKRGFFPAAGACLPLRMPTHGTLDASGNGWGCERGFVKESDACRPMSVDELALQEKNEAQEAGAGEERTGPETPACQMAYNKCTSGCGEAIYDRSKGVAFRSPDFEMKCIAACSQARGPCRASQEPCAAFEQACFAQCPDHVEDQAFAVRPQDINCAQICRSVCQAGRVRCEVRLRQDDPRL